MSSSVGAPFAIWALPCSLVRAFVVGSGNAALMYSIFGGDVNDMGVWLTEERLPDGWEPKNREALGHTIIVRSLRFPR